MSSNWKKAYGAVRAAKLNGSLKPKPCERCGADAATTHAHHDDYRRPLEVMWLCSNCHKQRHRELGWGGGGRPKEFSDSAVRKYATGSTFLEIAQRCGVTPAAVRYRVRILGIPIRAAA